VKWLKKVKMYEGSAVIGWFRIFVRLVLYLHSLVWGGPWDTKLFSGINFSSANQKSASLCLWLVCVSDCMASLIG